MTTAVHSGFKGQASGSSGSVREALGCCSWLGEQQSADVQLIPVHLVLKLGAIWPHEELHAPGDSQGQFAAGAGTQGGRGQGEAGSLAGRQREGEVAWLSAGPPGGYVPAAECRWADSWPGAAKQPGSWSVC